MADHSRSRRVAAQVLARLSDEDNELALDADVALELENRVALIMETALARRTGLPSASPNLQSVSLGRRRAADAFHPSASLRAAAVAFEEIYPALLEPHQTIEVSRAVGEAVALQEVVGGAVLKAAIGYVDYLLTRLDAVHLQERRALAAYLHDHTAQTVASAIQRLEYAEVPRAELKSLLESALGDIRELALNLRQYVGDQRLDEALEIHVVDAANRKPVVELRQVGVPHSFAPLKQETTFLIIREVVHNARKHASARNIAIDLKWSRFSLTARIEDDGCGFDQTVTGSSRMGLLICRERAESMSANLEITSKRGSGTTVTLTVAL